MRKCPVTRARLNARQTLAEAAQEAGVHLQAFFLQEKGVYSNILPAICRWLENHNLSPVLVSAEYFLWQKEGRRATGEEYAFSIYEWNEPLDLHPFIQFRMSLPMSRMQFAKRLGVHPNSLYRLEHNQTRNLPEQLIEALQDAGLPRHALDELRFRVKEWI